MTTDSLTRGERTRTSILEAAQTLFLEQGYGSTSMRQIAERAGDIAVGGIYNHFAAKQDILNELITLRSPVRLMMAALEEVRGQTGPDILDEALRRLAALAVTHIDFIQLAYIDIQTFDGAAMSELMAELLPVALAFGKRAVAAGGLRADLNPLFVMRALSSLIIGFALTQRLGFSEGRPRVDVVPDLPQEEWFDALARIFLHGVADN